MLAKRVTPPTSEDQLLARASNIAGATLSELASLLELDLPINSTHGKGWIGQLLECCLGADASSKPVPDFTRLGIELKTIPVNSEGKPKESTFVCTIPLLAIHQQQWPTSDVANKLRRVLWIPIEADTTLEFGQRRVGSPLLWSPNHTEAELLRNDWQELTDMIALGQLEQITGKQGVALQIRPKGANSKSLCTAIGADGARIQTLPRGFYLRASFTHKLLGDYL